MPSTTDQLRLRRKMTKLLNDRQNRSYISEKNVICQDRKLRGRIIKPTDLNHRKIRRTAVKKTFNSVTIEEAPLVKVIVPTKITMPTEITIPTEIIVPTEINVSTEIPMPLETTEPAAEGNICDEAIESRKEANTKEPSKYAILYKAIQRLWYENLQVFIYHSDSVNFTNFIYPFPELIAVQIKIVVPSSTERDSCQIISAKNFIFQKQAFLKMIDGPCDDTFTRHIIFILRSQNEEPRTMRLPPNRHAIKMQFKKYSPNNVIEAIHTNNDIGPVDLRIQYSDGLEPSDILNRNIMNKLQRLNTVIRRVPEPKITRHTTVPKNNIVYRSSNLSPLRSSQAGWKRGKVFNRKEKFVETIAPQQYQNWQKNCVYNDKFVGFLNSYQTSIIQSSLIMHNNNSSAICIRHMKTDMWLSYASRNEIFDREVSLAELDAIPIESFYKLEEDFNLDDYML